MHCVGVTTLAQQIGAKGSFLVTRPVGEQFLPLLETLLEQHTDDVVVLDFTGIELMDASFADEVFASIAAGRARRQSTQSCLVLSSLTASSRENLEFALISRPQREKGLRNCLLPVAKEPDERIELLGKVERHVAETFDVLRNHRTMTARELADLMAIDIGAASTRLKALYDLGLALRVEIRDESGKQFRYEWPV